MAYPLARPWTADIRDKPKRRPSGAMGRHTWGMVRLTGFWICSRCSALVANHWLREMDLGCNDTNLDLIYWLKGGTRGSEGSCRE